MAPLATLHACALLSLLRCHASLVWRYLPDAHSFIFVLVHQCLSTSALCYQFLFRFCAMFPQAVEGFDSSVGTADSLHHDEVW